MASHLIVWVVSIIGAYCIIVLANMASVAPRNAIRILQPANVDHEPTLAAEII